MTTSSNSINPTHTVINALHLITNKESVMKTLRNLSFLALLVLAQASAYAATTLAVNITVTIVASNAIEWSVADAAANVTGQREWIITGAAMNTAYKSEQVIAGNTITGPSTSVIAVKATALNFTNKGNISITSSIAVANGSKWNVGAAPGSNVFMLEASVDGGSNYLGTKVALTGTPLTLDATQLSEENCDLTLQFTTPTTVTLTANLTSAQVATITSTQN